MSERNELAVLMEDVRTHADGPGLSALARVLELLVIEDHEQLETASPERVPVIQGRLAGYRRIQSTINRANSPRFAGRQDGGYIVR